MTSLSANTTYHVRAYATNTAGISYGPDVTFTTAKLSQTITFDALSSQVYGTEFVKLTATASSSLPVSYASANPAVVRISNDTAFLLAADTVTITASQSGNASYLAATSVSRKLTIGKKILTITGATATNRQYDATTAATVTGATLSGKVNSDDVSLVLGTASFATKDTGTAKPVTVVGSSLSGTKAGNYTLTEVSGLSANIQPALVSASNLAAQSKVYDGTTSAVLSGTALAGVKGNENVSLYLGTGSFATKDTGTAKAVTVTGLRVFGADSANYALAPLPPNFLAASITPKSMRVTAASKTKVYGSDDPSLTWTDTGLVNGDALTGALSRSIGDSVGKYAIAQGTLSAGGNYAITYVGDSLSITKKTLTIAGATASNKVYDATTSATVTGAALADVVGTDAVSLTLGTASFASKDTGTAKPVTVTGSVLSGIKAGNYSLTEVSGLNANITAKPITVTAASKTKVYGSDDPSLTWTATTLLGTDAFTGSLSRSTGDSVGKYAIAQGTLNAGGNYAITYVGDSLSITKKTLTIAGATASNKVYDATTSATVTGAALADVVGTDAVSLTLGTASFDTKDAGTSKPVTVTGSVLSGAKAGNYSLTEVSGLNADITSKPITVTAASKTKVYGSADPALTYAAPSLLGTDAFTGSLSRSTGDSVGKYAIVQGTLSAGGNYVITYVGDSLVVTPAPLSITADNAIKDFDAADPTFTAKFSGLVNGETDAVVKGLVFTRAPGTEAGDYAIVPSGATAANYAISYVNGKLTVKEQVVGIASNVRRPVSKLLSANVPNVFAKPSQVSGRGDLGLSIPGCSEDNSCLSVDVQLPKAASIEVGIYDNLGVRVIGWNTVVNEAELTRLPATLDGRHVAHMSWNLRAENGRSVPEGVYLWKVKATLVDGTRLENVLRLGVRK